MRGGESRGAERGGVHWGGPGRAHVRGASPRWHRSRRRARRRDRWGSRSGGRRPTPQRGRSRTCGCSCRAAGERFRVSSGQPQRGVGAAALKREGGWRDLVGSEHCENPASASAARWPVAHETVCTPPTATGSSSSDELFTTARSSPASDAHDSFPHTSSAPRPQPTGTQRGGEGIETSLALMPHDQAPPVAHAAKKVALHAAAPVEGEFSRRKPSAQRSSTDGSPNTYLPAGVHVGVACATRAFAGSAKAPHVRGKHATPPSAASSRRSFS